MKKLTKRDYKKITKFYKSKKHTRKNALKTISRKFCSCVEKIKAKKKGEAIGICTKSVINRKGFKRGKFSCKRKPSIQLYKGGKRRRKKKTRKKRGGMTLEEKKKRIEELKEEMQEIWWNEKNKQNASADFIHKLRHSLSDKREELTRLKQEVLEYSGGPEIPKVGNNPNPGGSPIEGGKRRRKKKTRKKRGGDEKYKLLWEKCMNNYKLKKLEEQYINRNIKAQDFIDSRLMLTFGEILRGMNIAQPDNIEELEGQYRNIITNQATEHGSAANAIGLVIQRFVDEQSKKRGGKRRKKKTRKRRRK